MIIRVGGASKMGVMGMEDGRCIEDGSHGYGTVIWCRLLKAKWGSSSQNRLKPYFVGMGFSPALVDKVLQDHGEENADSLLDTFFAYSASMHSLSRQPMVPSHQSLRTCELQSMGGRVVAIRRLLGD